MNNLREKGESFFSSNSKEEPAVPFSIKVDKDKNSSNSQGSVPMVSSGSGSNEDVNSRRHNEEIIQPQFIP